jgi:hypothetical protein
LLVVIVGGVECHVLDDDHDRWSAAAGQVEPRWSRSQKRSVSARLPVQRTQIAITVTAPAS